MSVTGSSDLIGRAPGGRKLIAVVYADMVGYSRLIGLDDIGTLERLRTLRTTLIDPAIQEHGGRIIQTAGDSLLIVFDSIDGAVRCAVKMQKQVPDHDGDQPPDRAIRFRVGINIGDVIADGTDLHGDGVNVAVRLQAECPAGGICVSRAVRDHVHGRLDLIFDELGSLSLKNISRPVEVFLLRLGSEGIGPGLVLPARLAPSSATRAKPPRLSVLIAPLRNLRVPEEYKYLVEGIAEDISTDLSVHPDTFVVDPFETLRRGGDPASPRAVASSLGVGYVIQGSIRGIVDRLSTNLQLIHVETGVRLWSERFDIDIGGTIDAGKEISSRATFTLFLKLLEDALRRIETIPSAEWTPDDLATRGRALLARPLTAQRVQDPFRQEALQCFEQALARAPDAIFARMGIAGLLISKVGMGQSPSGGPDEARAEQLLADVLRVNGQSAIAHTLMGTLRRLQFRFNDSLIEHRVALEAAPNFPPAVGGLGVTLAFLGQPDKAIPLLERSLRFSPHAYSAPLSLGCLGLAHLLLGDTAEAITSLRTARAMNPRVYLIYCWLAAALGQNGELDEAGAALRQAIEMRPDLVSYISVLLTRASPQFVTLFQRTVYAGLRRAGLSDVWAETDERPLGWVGNQ
jgi:class 3 adenylate cyclase/TolB-like protein